MNFKKLLMSCLSAAMVVSSLTGGAYATDVVVPEAEQTASNIINYTKLVEVDSALLKENATAKNHQSESLALKGGPAGWAFDGDNHWWHQAPNAGAPSDTNPIWIQTGFGGETKQIKKVTYKSRDDGNGGVIKKYQLMVANKTDGTPVVDTDFSEVKRGTFQNIQTPQEIVLDNAVPATHIRLVALSVYHKDGSGDYATARRIMVYEEIPAQCDTNKEADYWDYEKENNSLGQQIEDDVWTYQIRKNGTWENLPQDAFHGNVWMCQNSEDPNYFWAKLGKSNITANLKTGQEALAFTWKASKPGYYKAGIEKNITDGGGSEQLNAKVWHASANEFTKDGQEIHTQPLSIGQLFTTKIVKVNTDDRIRIGALNQDAWAQNFLPYVEEVGVAAYAEQYLEEVADAETQGNYSDYIKGKVASAKAELRTAIETGVNVEEKLTALEEIIASLGSYTPVESITLDKTKLSLNINDTAKLTATVNPNNALQEVVWESSNPSIATVVDGTVTAVAAGTATITVKSLDNPQHTAECAVTVASNVNTEALEAILAEAKTYKQDNYTDASFNSLQDAIRHADEVIASPEKTQAMVDEAELALTEAISKLVRAYKVTTSINEKEEVIKYAAGERVTVTAEPVDGKQFSHWTYNGTPICYITSYTFTVSGDTRIEAVYVDAGEDIVKQVSVLCDATYADGKIKFYSKHSVPSDSGYTVVKTGVVATDQKGLDTIKAAGEELNLDTKATQRLKKYGVNTSAFLANFTQYLKTSKATTWHARGYVQYIDAEGTTHTVYSELTSCEVK